MKPFWTVCCATLALTLAGCSSSDEAVPVATTEDEFAAYDALVEEQEEQTAAEAAAVEQ